MADPFNEMAGIFRFNVVRQVLDEHIDNHRMTAEELAQPDRIANDEEGEDNTNREGGGLDSFVHADHRRERNHERGMGRGHAAVLLEARPAEFPANRLYDKLDQLRD